jgi:ribosomal protein S18 acetylase RimI-like enzyme
VFLDGAVHPAWRGRGVGTALCEWLVERGTAVVAATDDGLPAWLELRGEVADDARRDLFTSLGFTPLRHFLELRRDLAAPIAPAAVPPDLELVPYDRADDEALRVAHNEAFRDQWGSEERDRASWDKWFTGSRHFRGDLSSVVFDGDEIAAYALSAVFADDVASRGYSAGWTTHLGVRRPWRARGIARALLTHSLRAFRDAGLEYAVLDVDGENPSGAVALYRSVGYETVRDVVSWARPVEITRS